MTETATRSRPVRVVIVDDTFDLRELLRMALTRGGMEVVGEAGDGLAGIEAVRAERPDVVLLDLSMPVMDGLEALPSIRELVPHGKIIVLSGFGATQMSERALATGADGYLQKGMSLKRILEYVRGMVEGSEESAKPAPVPANGLSLVPPPESRPASIPALDEAPVSTQPDVSAWDALALAPYGVVEVADEPHFPIVHANLAAQRLLGNQARFGVPLGTIAPQLTSLVAYNRLDGEASFVAEVGGVGVQATVRRASRSLLVYLDSTSEDIGNLRRSMASTAEAIRGPVAVLCGVAESIGRAGDELTEQELARLMSSVTRQARELDAITADLLTVLEVQRGTLLLHPEPVEPIDAIDTVTNDRSIVTVNAVVEDERRVLADPRRLEQMLGNLISNALKHGRPPIVVAVRAHPRDETLLVVEVTDGGDGVPPEAQDQLFREFTRAGGSTTSGSGLGLYVVRALAEAQGGSVTYRDAASGGACFTLTLPAV